MYFYVWIFFMNAMNVILAIPSRDEVQELKSQLDILITQRQDDHHRWETILQNQIRDLRLEFDAIKTKTCADCADKDNNRVKNEQLTVKWLSGSIAELRAEISEMVKSLNSTTELQRRQTYLTDISMLQNDVVSLRHDVESLKVDAAKSGAKFSIFNQDVDALKQLNSDMAAKLINFTQQVHAHACDWTSFSKLFQKNKKHKVFKKMIVVKENPLEMKVFTVPDEAGIKTRKGHGRSFMVELLSNYETLWHSQKQVEKRLNDIEEHFPAVFHASSVDINGINNTTSTLQSLQNRVNILENSFSETIMQIKGQEKLHLSVLELLESVQDIEAKFDSSTPDLKREISKLEFLFSQITTNATVLRKNQDNQREIVKKIGENLSITQTKLDTYEKNVSDMNKKLNSIVSAPLSSFVHFSKQNAIIKGNTATEENVFINSRKASNELFPLQKQYNNFVQQLPNDCSYIDGPSGVYWISPDKDAPILVYCEISNEPNPNSYTVIQRRINGETDFNQNWEEYAKGFGNLQGEFWLGNEMIHRLTKNNDKTVKIEFKDTTGRSWYAQYDLFSVASRQEGFGLSVKGFTGNVSNALEYQNRMQFSTRDSDHDISNSNCAANYEGGWWFSHCQHTNLNGKYNLSLTWFDSSTNEWLTISSSKIMLLKRRT